MLADLRLTLAVDGPRRLSCLSIKRIWQVWLIELNIDILTDLWIVTCDLFEVTLRRLTQVLLCGVLPALHQTIKLDLLQVVAPGAL